MMCLCENNSKIHRESLSYATTTRARYQADTNELYSTVCSRQSALNLHTTKSCGIWAHISFTYFLTPIPHNRRQMSWRIQVDVFEYYLHYPTLVGSHQHIDKIRSIFIVLNSSAISITLCYGETKHDIKLQDKYYFGSLWKQTAGWLMRTQII